MKFCCRCQKSVNVNRNKVFIGIADIWNDHCEECGNLVDSGIIPWEPQTIMGPEEPSVKLSELKKILNDFEIKEKKSDA